MIGKYENIRRDKISNINFSQALEQLKSHYSIRRKNWSGDKYIFLLDKNFGFLPFIAIHTKDGNLGVYSATNCDLLADDWETC